MTAPGPDALARHVVVADGAAPPACVGAAEVVVVDEATLADPARWSGGCTRLWSGGSAAVVDLRVDPVRFRRPGSCDRGAMGAGAGVRAVVRPAPLPRVGQHLRRPRRRAGLVVGPQGGRLGADRGADGRRPATSLLADGTRGMGRRRAAGRRSTRRELGAGGRARARRSTPGGSTPMPAARRRRAAELAPDQLAAVAHGGGPARIIAPAGSGKTRVLTERLRHLVADRGYERDRRARRRLQPEGPGGDGGAHAPASARASRRSTRWATRCSARRSAVARRCSTSATCAGCVERPRAAPRRRVNTDPIAPYLEGLSLDPPRPARPRRGRGRARRRRPASPTAFAPVPRRRCAATACVDFDEQIYLAIEAAARRRRVPPARPGRAPPPARRRVPGPHARPRAAACGCSPRPTYDVFGVGDDDQMIYGHVGADPRSSSTSADCSPAPAPTRSRSTTAARRGRRRGRARCSATTTCGWRRRSGPGPTSTPTPDALAVALHPADGGRDRRSSRSCRAGSSRRVDRPPDRRAHPRQLAAARAARRARTAPACRSTRSLGATCSTGSACAPPSRTCASPPTRRRRAGRPRRGPPAAQPGLAATGSTSGWAAAGRSTTSSGGRAPRRRQGRPTSSHDLAADLDRARRPRPRRRARPASLLEAVRDDIGLGGGDDAARRSTRRPRAARTSTTSRRCCRSPTCTPTRRAFETWLRGVPRRPGRRRRSHAAAASRSRPSTG